MNLSLERLGGCKEPISDWWLKFLCYLCKNMIKCSANVQLSDAWVENKPRFTAISLGLQGKKTVLVSVPGEAIYELGQMIKNQTRHHGFSQTMVVGCANNHVSNLDSLIMFLLAWIFHFTQRIFGGRVRNV
jgi:hypothetical protein